MIQSIKHRGLKNLHAKGSTQGLRADYVGKIARMLARLDEIAHVAEMDIPGFRLHALKGDLKGFWSVRVSENWRIVFRFEGGHIYDVNLVDYH